MKIILIALVLALSFAPFETEARSSKTLNPAMVPTSDPALKGISDAIATSKSRQAELAVQAAGIARQIAAIKAKAQNQKADLGEQLPQEDLDTLNLLGTKLRYLHDAGTIEAVRQHDLEIAREVYRASFFTATMMTEYVGEKGALDDDFDDYCRAKAKVYGMDGPVDLLLSLQDFIVDNGVPQKKK